MLGSYQLLVLIKIILFQFLGLMCIEDDLFRRYRRLRSSSDSNNPTGSSFIIVTSVFIDDYQAVLNCSTKTHVSHDRLDWYFRPQSSELTRVIWQRGRSNIPRYSAFSPDQHRHYLRIKPVKYNDSGVYTCLDQTSGISDEIELVVRDSRSCAGSVIRLQMTNLICLVLLSSLLSRRTASESEVT